MPSKSRRADPVVELLKLEEPDKITSFFASLGADDDVTVSIYAIDPKDRLRGRSFLFQLPSVASLTGPALMAQVLDKYGPGEYLAEGRDADHKIKFSPRFQVGPIRGRVEIPDPRPPATPAAAPASGLGELAAVLDRQTKLLEAVLNRPPPSLVDSLRDLKELRELIAPPAAPAFDLGKVLEAVSGVLKLRDELGDVGGPENPLGVFARALAPALAKIADRATDQPAALPAPSTAATSAATETEASAAPAAGDDVGASKTMLRVYVAQLIQMAEQGVTPADAARRVVETLGGFAEPMVAGVVEWLNDENIVDELAAHDPRARHYAKWIDQTVDAVLDAMLEPDAAPATPANGAHAPAPG